MNTKNVANALRGIATNLVLIADEMDTTQTVTAATMPFETKPVEEPKKRGRKAKAVETEVDEFSAAPEKGNGKAEVDDFSDFELTPEETEPEITAAQLREKLVAVAMKHDKQKAYGMLNKYKAKKVDELDPKHYGALYKDLSGALS